MTAQPLTSLEAAHLIDAYRHHWTGHTCDRAGLIEAAAGHGDDAVAAVMNRWVVAMPGRPPSVAWLGSQLDRVDRAESIGELRAAAREALRRCRDPLVVRAAQIDLSRQASPAPALPQRRTP